MEIPAFSIFSAITELFVSIAILYVIISNMHGRPLAWQLLIATLAFETIFNISYMTRQTLNMRAAESAATNAEHALITEFGVYFYE